MLNLCLLMPAVLGQMEKPDVDLIEGLSPAISIDQKTTSRNPRSTVGTVTEIYDYLRLLYARIGIPHCPQCGKEIKKQTIDQIVDHIMKLPERTKIQLLAPVVRGRKGEHKKLLESLRKGGYVRVRVDGIIYDLSEDINLEKNKKHSIEVVVDRLVIKDNIVKRLTDSIETVMELSKGLLLVDVIDGEELTFSQDFACTDCGISIGEIEPRLFSFNNPFGACPSCMGLGSQLKIDPELIIPNPSLSIMEGAISAPGWNSVDKPGSYARSFFEALSKHYNFDLNTPFKDLDEDIKDIILYGSRGEKIRVEYENARGRGSYVYVFEGIIPNMHRKYSETSSDYMKQEYEELMTNHTCHVCGGSRLKAEALSIKLGGKNIAQITDMSVLEIRKFFKNLELTDTQKL